MKNVTGTPKEVAVWVYLQNSGFDRVETTEIGTCVVNRKTYEVLPRQLVFLHAGLNSTAHGFCFGSVDTGGYTHIQELSNNLKSDQKNLCDSMVACQSTCIAKDQTESYKLLAYFDPTIEDGYFLYS